MRTKRTFWGLPALLALAAACSGGGGVLELDEYAEKACQASEDRADDLRESLENLSEAEENAAGVGDEGDAEDAINESRDAMVELRNRFLGFMDALIGIGRPDEDDGEDFVEALREARDQIAEDTQEAIDDLGELDAEDVGDDPTELTDVLTSFGNAFSEADAAGDEFPEIQEALDAEGDCGFPSG